MYSPDESIDTEPPNQIIGSISPPEASKMAT